MANYTALAEAAVREAGNLVKSFSNEHALHVEEKGSAYDFVTDADRQSQQLIKRIVLSAFPTHRFIGEEDGLEDDEIARAVLEAGPDEYYWLADPLDGTLNYIHRLGGYCISLALMHGGRSICGVLYALQEDELFLAELGAGATRNGVPMHASQCGELCHALTATGYAGADLALRERSKKWIDAVAMASMNMRNLGSCARAIALTAAGSLDAFFEIGPHPWDVAASLLLCQEAGCSISMLSGAPYRFGNPSVLVSAPGIHEALCALIRENGG